MSVPLARITQIPGIAPNSGVTVPTRVISRYFTATEDLFSRGLAPYVDRFWEAGRNQGSENGGYAGVGTDQFDSLGGEVFTTPVGSLVSLVSGGFLAQSFDGTANLVLQSSITNIAKLTSDFTYLLVSEIDSLPSQVLNIAGSNGPALDPRFAVKIGANGDLQIDNGKISGDQLQCHNVFVPARRDLVWFAWRNGTKTAAGGRRVATPVATGTWASSFDSGLIGEQFGGAFDPAKIFIGRLLCRIHCPFYGPDNASFAAMLNLIAAHYGCAS